MQGIIAQFQQKEADYISKISALDKSANELSTQNSKLKQQCSAFEEDFVELRSQFYEEKKEYVKSTTKQLDICKDHIRSLVSTISELFEYILTK